MMIFKIGAHVKTIVLLWECDMMSHVAICRSLMPRLMCPLTLLHKLFEYLDHRVSDLRLMFMRQDGNTFDASIGHHSGAADGLSCLAQGNGMARYLVLPIFECIKVADDAHLTCRHAHFI